MAKIIFVTLFLSLCVPLVLSQFGLFPQQDGFFLNPKRIAGRISGFLNPGRNQRPGITNDVHQGGNYNQGSNGGGIVFPTDEASEDNYQENNQASENNQANYPNNQGDETYADFQNNQGGFNQDTTHNPVINSDQNVPSYPTQDASNGFAVNGNTEGTISEANDASYSGNTDTTTTTLSPLSPVLSFESRSNANFGPSGIFGSTCNTVEGNPGSCIIIQQCEAYYKLLQQSRSNPAIVQLLRRAHCGFDGNNPKVCCPLQSFPVAPVQDTTTTTTTTTTTPAPTSVPPGKTLGDNDFVASLPVPPECGASNATHSRVVGGVDAKLGDFPWMGIIGYISNRFPDVRWLCGCSIITTKHTLTAAHCIHGKENEIKLVRVGELDLAREDDGATPVDVLVKKMIKHEQYSPTSFTNDIGILVLDKALVYTDLIKPICLPKSAELRATTFEDYNPMIAGWGNIEFRGPSATHLQVLQLPVQSNERCAKAYAAYAAQKIDERVLCAGYAKGGKDACQGDSGGPLMQPIWNSNDLSTYFYQIGIVSFGKRCAEAGFPGVYSRVTHFMPWIEQTVLGTR